MILGDFLPCFCQLFCLCFADYLFIFIYFFKYGGDLKSNHKIGLAVLQVRKSLNNPQVSGHYHGTNLESRPHQHGIVAPILA